MSAARPQPQPQPSSHSARTAVSRALIHWRSRPSLVLHILQFMADRSNRINRRSAKGLNPSGPVSRVSWLGHRAAQHSSGRLMIDSAQLISLHTLPGFIARDRCHFEFCAGAAADEPPSPAERKEEPAQASAVQRSGQRF